MEAQKIFVLSDIVQVTGQVFVDADMKYLKRADFDKDPHWQTDSLRSSL